MVADPTDTPSDPSGERAALTSVTGRPLDRDRRSWAWPAVALVLAAAAIGAAAWGWSTREERAELEQRLFEASAVIDGMTVDLAAADSLLEARPTAEELAPILAASNAVEVELSGAPPARGRLLGSDAGALLTAAGLPPLPAERTYRLWRLGPTGAEPIAELGRAPDGFLMARFLRADFVEGATELGVAASSATGESPAGDPPDAYTLRGAVPR